MKSPRYYWIRWVILVLLIVVGYSIIEYLSSSNEEAQPTTSDLVDSRMAIIDKNKTAKSIINNMLIDQSTKITVLGGTNLALTDYVQVYTNPKKVRGYLDLTHLTPSKYGDSFVLWSKTPQNSYHKIREIPPNNDYLHFPLQDSLNTLFITLETDGVSDLPSLDNIIVAQQ